MVTFVREAVLAKPRTKGELNVDKGELTIYSAQLTDDDYYYYKFYTGAAGTPDTGSKYEILLDVNDCDTSSDSAQCSEGEICRNNVCETAVACDWGSDCGSPGMYCISDYCQPQYCTATGQCVHGQVCSHDITRSCVYPVKLTAAEGTVVNLLFAEPGTEGTYEEITWYKGSTGSNYRIVYVHPILTEGESLYYGDFCSGSSPCESSDKGELNIDTGELTIYAAELPDQDYYYYKFYSSNLPDTGIKYENYLEVYVVPEVDDLTLEGLLSIAEEGTAVQVTCAIDRIKPAADDFYWTLDGVRYNGSVTSIANSDGTFAQENNINLTLTREDDGKNLHCTLVPVYGTTIMVEETVNVAYGPSGNPRTMPSKVEKYENEEVVLICDISCIDPGNPVCDIFIWSRIGDENAQLPSTKQLTFIMDADAEGNFTCQCANAYGQSGVSGPSEVLFVQKDSPTGNPSMNPEFIEAQENEEVMLTCEISAIDPGNPDCDVFIWSKVGNDMVQFPNSQNLRIVVNNFTQGYYICRCENYGISEISNTAEVIMVEKDTSDTGSSDTRLIILATVGGVLALIGCIAIAVVIFRRCQHQREHTRHYEDNHVTMKLVN